MLWCFPMLMHYNECFKFRYVEYIMTSDVHTEMFPCESAAVEVKLTFERDLMKMKGFWPLDDFPSSQSMKIDREESGEAPVLQTESDSNP